MENKHLYREIEPEEGKSSLKFQNAYNNKTCRSTNLTCPMCSSVLYENINTKRIRCLKCGMLFSKESIEKIKRKIAIRNDWMRLSG